MNNIAALLDDVSVSQNSFSLIRSFNSLSNNENAMYCFYNNISAPPMQPLFSMMNVYYINSLNNGHLIATTLSNANTLLNVHSAVKKYLYLWDLEWIRSGLGFSNVNSILKHPDINIIARSKSHAFLIENYTNQKVRYILDDWNPKQLLEIINGRAANN